MLRKRSIWGTLVLAIGLAFTENSLALDWLTLYPFDAEAILRFDGTRRSHESGTTATDTEWRTGFRLTQDGYTYHPNFLLYSLELEPYWIWGKVKFTGSETDDRDGNLLNYAFRADLWRGAERPFDFYAALQQYDNLNVGSLGSRYDTEVQSHSFGANWSFEPFPMQFLYESRALDQSFRSTLNAPSSRRDEKLDTWIIRGRSSKLNAEISHQTLDDRLEGRQNDYEQDVASVLHRLKWGRDSHLRSRAHYRDRTGFNANRRITVNEFLRIQHTDSVYSENYFDYIELTQILKNTDITGRSRVNHDLYGNLHSRAEVWGSSNTSDVQDKKSWRAGLGTQYQKREIFEDLGIYAGLDYDYQRTDRDSKLGVIEVVDEAHVVPLSGEVILDKRFILTATIIITDESGQLVYVRGYDYEIFELSGDLTQIQAVPGGRIEPGSTILVSYKAEALPSQEYSTTYTTARLGFSLPWMRFSHYQYELDNELISGAGESYLTDRVDVATRLDFFWSMGEIDANVSAERTYNEVADYEATQYTFYEQFDWMFHPQASMRLNLLQQFAETSDRDYDLYNLELTVDWKPHYTLTIRPMIGAWYRLDKSENLTGGEREDDYIMAGLRGTWVYRKLTIELDYNFNRRSVNQDATDENRLWLHVSRRF